MSVRGAVNRGGKMWKCTARSQEWHHYVAERKHVLSFKQDETHGRPAGWYLYGPDTVSKVFGEFCGWTLGAAMDEAAMFIDAY